MTAEEQIASRIAHGHIPALDGVRGLALLLVLLHNFNLQGPIGPAPVQVLNAGVELGWGGVQLFFVLSGFLITGILLDTRAAPRALRAFYMRRVLRIFPLYYLVLLAYFVVAPAVFVLPAWVLEEHRHQIWYWLYLANWTAPFGLGVMWFGHFWSLAVEEQFYLVWPLAIRSSSTRRVAWICLAIMAVALAARVAMRAAGASPAAVYSFTVTRMDALAAGGAIAAVLRDPAWSAVAVRSLRRGAAAAVAALLVVAAVTKGFPRTNALVQTLGLTLLAIVCAQLVLAVTVAQARSPLNRYLSLAPLRALGRFSYAMYVFHLPLHLLVHRELRGWLHSARAVERIAKLALYVPVMTLLTFALAWVSWHACEKHFLALKRHFVPGAPPVPPPSTST